MKFKGIELEGTYELEVYKTYFKVYDSKENLVYYEDSDGFWNKSEYDSKGNCVYYEDSDGYWAKREYDSKGKCVYYENSTGYTIDKRVKELSVKEISKLLGYEIKVVK